MDKNKYFTTNDSIVRKIWGKSDTILFIFAGAAAEFALNKAVDWLYFTGKLPADPIGRLFSTVTYAQQIVFANVEDAHKAIDRITAIHSSVEKSRGAVIPDWAYRDVLYMLIHYSIASFELLERKLSMAEKEEVFDVFYRLGCRMNLTNLPASFAQWMPDRAAHLLQDLHKSELTDHLFIQYQKHLGAGRYRLLLETQKMLVPHTVSSLLHYKKLSIVPFILPLYKISRTIKMDKLVKSILLPPAYKERINALDWKEPAVTN
jgi:ER-bound oxygenase mpaB/B'/Rubber oxygenase, catalytic domain